MKHRLIPTQPERFHGIESQRPYFEGWYFKLSSKELTIAFICGMSCSKKAEDDHSFMQIITGNPHKSYYVPFAYDAFKADKEKFEVYIGDNFLSMDRLEMHIDHEDIKIDVDLRYSEHLPIETNSLSPGIMGPFSYIPNMQCNHGVLSLKNTVAGNIILNDTTYDMNQAIGYIEKDRGEAFPSSWIWLQGNVAKESTDDVTFMSSVAIVPFMGAAFKGLIAVISVDGVQYRFATYNGAKPQSIEKTEHGVHIVLKKGKYKLYINAYTDGFEKLIAPTRSGMDREIYESISAEISLKLTCKDHIIYQGVVTQCGMEVSDIEKLMK
ncbi:MAG: hypothetical protein KAQ68_06020 [Clostridiales bacterium]|nr:hypothetical protein [Clostridiales bacterium]